RVTVTDPVQREKDKKEAISYAAFRVLDKYLFPQGSRYPFIDSTNPAGKKADFKGQLAFLGFPVTATPTTPAAQIGVRAADAVIQDRANDGAFQGNGYVDPDNT